MYSQVDFYFFVYWYDGVQEIGYIFMQLCFINVVVFCQMCVELVKGVVFFCFWQVGDDIVSQFIDICFVYCFEIDFSLMLFFFIVICFCFWVFKDMQFKGGESDLIEMQCLGVVWQFIFQIGVCLVEDWYKVVVYGIDVVGCEVVDVLLIVGNSGCILFVVGFNIFVDGNVFDD